MSPRERLLIVLLRLTAIVMLVALVPVVMPFSWMETIHGWLVPGELPNTPMVGYLTRSLSALFAACGSLVLFLSLDVRRYLPVIRFMIVASIVFGVVLVAVDIAVGLPASWTISEAICTIGWGVLLYWLAVTVRWETG